MVVPVALVVVAALVPALCGGWWAKLEALTVAVFTDKAAVESAGAMEPASVTEGCVVW